MIRYLKRNFYSAGYVPHNSFKLITNLLHLLRTCWDVTEGTDLF